MCVDRTLERVAATSAQPVSRPRACKSQKKKGVAAHGRSSDAKCRAWQGGSVKIATRERSARYPLYLRIGDRRSVVSGKSVTVRVDHGVRRISQNKNIMYQRITLLLN